jgi:hypothetical protein
MGRYCDFSLSMRLSQSIGYRLATISRWRRIDARGPVLSDLTDIEGSDTEVRVRLRQGRADVQRCPKLDSVNRQTVDSAEGDLS